MRPTPRKVPSATKTPKEVKLNAGAIFREEQHFRGKLEAEASRLAWIQAGGFDMNEYMEWEKQKLVCC